MPRPIRASVSLAALKNNLEVVRKYAPESKVWAVIKANAYGHKIQHIWQALSDADGFALLDIEEAILLRKLGWKGPILLLEGVFCKEDFKIVIQFGLTCAVHSDWQINEIHELSTENSIDVYLKINSGMNRLGYNSGDAKIAFSKLESLPQVRQITLMTHFANADRPGGTVKPLQLVRDIVCNIDLPLCMANSAAILWESNTHADWVRAGIMLYGVSPSGRAEDLWGVGIRPAMSLTSEIIAIQNLNPGDEVGYGGRYIAQKPQRIGIVACGYADGYPRHAPTGTPVMVEGQIAPLAGTVSMDMLAVDLTNIPGATLGSHVELWGENLSVDEIAGHAGTLGYELLTALTARVPFYYS